MTEVSPQAMRGPERPGAGAWSPTAGCSAGTARRVQRGVLWALLLCLNACGARDAPRSPGDASTPDAARPVAESCDGFDNDLDLRVDEDFRADGGLYLSTDHCGSCGVRCEAMAFASGVLCAPTAVASPRCEAMACESGYSLARDGSCVPAFDFLCLPCLDDSQCGPVRSARCAHVSGLRRCVTDCGDACPAPFQCGEDDDGRPTCLPPTDACVCNAGAPDFSFACATEEGGTCPGRRTCEAGILSECVGPAERCDGTDNDCDGLIDETFVDESGAYSLDDRHCGRCGLDCNANNPGVRLACGGDPFVPTCVVDCIDLRDGKQVGDAVDADGRIDTGCECVVASLRDGISRPSEPVVDDNCDGAEGEVLRGLYVATDGDDTGPGSPTRPLRSIAMALARADETRNTVFVAAGVYAETLQLRDGVSLLGGYRRDFLERDILRHEVRIVAPQGSATPFGAAVVGDGVGQEPTQLSGLTVQGRDVDGASAAAVAMTLTNPGPGLSLLEVILRSGRPGVGVVGVAGAIGSEPASSATAGALPRAAIEDENHSCVVGARNVTQGGAGGRNRCSGFEVSGGDGGSGVCPAEAFRQASGASGRGASLAPGGPGGLGGYDVVGPLQFGAACNAAYCCGLADFRVPAAYEQARPGYPGTDGALGAAGAGCSQVFGRFIGDLYMPSVGQAGTAGLPGSGGGGGGAGGGSVYTYLEGCPYLDGLGGGGGGGGAGGCGGAGGAGGGSGGPAVALLIRGDAATLPALQRVTFSPAPGAAGGRGGDGGDGGQGGPGAPGGSLPRELRSTPTLAGPTEGEQGGSGGNGGAGGGGGGGCGGVSVGLWVDSVAISDTELGNLPSENLFVLGSGGEGGPGGGGARPGQGGRRGLNQPVVKQ